MENSKQELSRLALMQAVYSALGSELSTRGGKNGAPNVRTRANEYLTELYLTTGADRVSLEVNGAKVGTFSLSFTKPKDEVEPYVDDHRKFVEWLRTTDGGLDALTRLVNGEPQLVLKAATYDGELPDGCSTRRVVEPPRIKSQTLRVDAEKVANALGGQLQGAVLEVLGLPSTPAPGGGADE